MKNWNILVIAISLLVCIGYATPLYNTVQDLKGEQVKLVKNKAEKETLREDLKNAQKEVAETSIDKKIPFHANQEGLLRDLVVILKKSGFSFEGFNFALGKHQTLNTSQILTNVQVKGPTKNIKTLLSFIEHNDRFLGLEGLSFSTQDPKRSGFTSISLSLYALFQE